MSEKLIFENSKPGYLRVLSSEKLDKDIFEIEESGETIVFYRVRSRERETENEDGSCTYDGVLVPYHDKYDTPDWPGGFEEDPDTDHMYAAILPHNCDNIKVAKKVKLLFQGYPTMW